MARYAPNPLHQAWPRLRGAFFLGTQCVAVKRSMSHASGRDEFPLCVEPHLPGTGASIFASRASTHLPFCLWNTESVCPARVTG